MIRYTNDASTVLPHQMKGFCAGWRRPLSAGRLYSLLTRSFAVEIGMDGDRVVGFAQAISDGELFAFIPLIEVKAEYQGRGIGSELLNRLMTRLEGHYGIDLLCDPGLKPFYEKAGMTEVSGMCIRNFSALADN